jgi:hypothetical protein
VNRFWKLLSLVLALFGFSACNIVRDPEFLPPTATTIVIQVPVDGATPVVLPVTVRLPANAEDAQQYTSFWSFAEFQDIQTPGEEDYEITILPEPYRQSFSWCADTPERLQQILGQLAVAFFIEDVQINDALILQSETEICHQWDTILEGWTAGQTAEVAVMYVINAPIFDGVFDYEAGTYVHRITVNVADS